MEKKTIATIVHRIFRHIRRSDDETDRYVFIVRPDDKRTIRVETLERPQDYDEVDERPWLLRFDETWANFEKGVTLDFKDDVVYGSVVEYHDEEDTEDEGGLPYLIIHNDKFNRTWRVDLIGDIDIDYSTICNNGSEYCDLDVRYGWFDMIYRATQLE